jgi:Ca2+-binding RTX toxin-like protein
MAKTYKGGTNGANDITADYGNTDGTNLNGNGGNDTLRGGNYDDLLTGGQGNDEMFGGAGKDVFRFFGLETTSTGGRPSGYETDRIYDLNFDAGDRMVFQSFAETAANGTLDSFEGIVAVVANSGWNAAGVDGNNNLVLSYDFGDGIVQNIIISNGFSDYLTALGEGGGGDAA